MRNEPQDIDGPAGRIEALLDQPADFDGANIVLVCHPHPQHGGTMQNKVVHTIARAATDVGYAALRFNYRGVGRSDGQWDEGVGELADAVSAVRWLEDRYPHAALHLAGFSFGAGIAVRLAERDAPASLITVAPAVQRDHYREARVPDIPWLVIIAGDDELIDVDTVMDWLNGLPPGPTAAIIDGASHFFHGRLGALRRLVAGHLRRSVLAH